MFEWIAQTGGGEITRLERHVARREAWVVDVTRPDGSVLEGFLRLDRHEVPANSSTSLVRETKVIQALADTDIPVPAVYGRNDELRCTLFERVRGRSDIDALDDPVQQRAVMEDFIRVIARMHTLDLDELGLADAMPYLPTTPAEAALNDVDLALEQWQGFLEHYTEPLITYGVSWLRRNAPTELHRLSLVQGDTGPVNFMFDGDRVSAIIDLEWAHYGDPLEDIGNICVREFWNPSGGLDGLFHLYEQESGIPYTRFAAQYYRVQQNVRGMIPIHAVTENAHPRESLAWYLCYRYLGDRATCQALAEAAGVAVEVPEMPAAEGAKDIVAAAAVYSIERDVAPKLTDAFAASRATDATRLIRLMDRRRRYGAIIDAVECDEMAPLLGARPATKAEGLQALDDLIRTGTFDDDAVITYLTRRALRDEWLHEPAVSLYPERTWSELDA
ncbi:phosphotransferase family protein [Rhabdothermincola salaria]|uniref:phosphotransferase family protein n=1 Tax=Rhabdothermincola salaria TaxID=2903142 RepID=UPI001E49AD71|nr:phosphotransferase family protein [Rhabdothermincola salaria]MCD9625619.1 phosphotransferase family protein [Rhabdothermincola salaria]